jgi:primosomal protein N' (replication factor Y)
VILQTYHPEHEVIRAVAGHDYGAFYSGEIAHRRYLGYPPFLRLVRLLFRSPSLDGADREAARLARRLRADARRRSDSPEVLGPTPCFFPRVRGLYRWQMLLRGTDPTVLIPDDLPEGWAVDVDPVNLL